MRPFLDPARDVLVSVEQTRHRLLALSALCPGASTLLANLLRRAAVPPPLPLPGQQQEGKQGSPRRLKRSGSSSSVDAAASQKRTAGGRRWLRAYMNGCGNKIHVVRLTSSSLANVPFADAAAAMHAATGVLMIGVMRGGRSSSSASPSVSSSPASSVSLPTAPAVAGTVLNPGRRLLRGGDSAVVICATGAAGARAAAALDYSERLLGKEQAAGGRSRSSPPRPPSSTSRSFSGVRSGPIDYVAASASESLDPSASVDDAAAAAIALGSFRSSSTWGAAATLARWARAPFDLVGGVAAAVFGAVDPRRKEKRKEKENLKKREAVVAKKLKASSPSSGSDSDLPPPPEGVDCTAVPAETESVDWEEGECDVGSLLPRDDGGGTAALPLTAAKAAAAEAEAEAANPARATMKLGSPASSFDDAAGYVDDEFYFAAERPRGSGSSAKAAGAAESGAEAAAARATTAERAASLSSPPSFSAKPRFSNHIIVAGADASFLAFAEQVRASDPLASLTPLVILSPYRPAELGAIAALGGPVFWIRGDAASAEGLSAAAAASARALVYLALPQKPGGGGGIGSLGGAGGSGKRRTTEGRASSPSPGAIVVRPDGRVAFVPGGSGAAPSASPTAPSSPPSSSPEQAAAWASIAASASFEDSSLPSSSAAFPQAGGGGGGEGLGGRADRAAASRSAVLADAPGLLCCYGAGEVDGSATPPYAVIELCFTSSLRFLQPGLLLKGVSAGVPSDDFGWRRRKGHSSSSSSPPASSSPSPAAAASAAPYSFNNTSTANHVPRRSWLARKRQEKAAAAEGLAAWQANPYYAAVRSLFVCVFFLLSFFIILLLLLRERERERETEQRSKPSLISSLPHSLSFSLFLFN